MLFQRTEKKGLCSLLDNLFQIFVLKHCILALECPVCWLMLGCLKFFLPQFNLVNNFCRWAAVYYICLDFIEFSLHVCVNIVLKTVCLCCRTVLWFQSWFWSLWYLWIRHAWWCFTISWWHHLYILDEIHWHHKLWDSHFLCSRKWKW